MEVLWYGKEESEKGGSARTGGSNDDRGALPASSPAWFLTTKFLVVRAVPI